MNSSVVVTEGKKARKPRISKKDVVDEETEIAEVSEIPKRRGAGRVKKTAQIVAVVTPNGVEGLLSTQYRPLIAHLPVHTNQLSFTEKTGLFKYDPNVPDPMPFDQQDDNLSYLNQDNKLVTVETHPVAFNEIIANEAIQTDEDAEDEDQVAVTIKKIVNDVEIHQNTQVRNSSLPVYYQEKLMVQYQDSNRVQTLPNKTDIHCFWDCHAFHGAPCVIPISEAGGIWKVYGNFCSPACAVSYLFSQRMDAQQQWERYACLNRMYPASTLSAVQGIQAAPPRETLRVFGGSLDISEFRAIVAEKRLRIDILTPPMVSIIQTMDTKPIDFYEASLKNTFIPADGERLQKSGAQGLRLRRSKPIKEKETTLEYCMGITNS